MNFEVLDQSLHNFIRHRNFIAFTVTEFRPIIHQLATALDHLSLIGLVHGDIRRDNIMSVNPDQHPPKVKLIDFVLAHLVSDINPSVLMGTTWYVAGEVILMSPYSEAIDMWSQGLILAELTVGRTLYRGTTLYGI